MMVDVHHSWTIITFNIITSSKAWHVNSKKCCFPSCYALVSYQETGSMMHHHQVTAGEIHVAKSGYIDPELVVTLSYI